METYTVTVPDAEKDRIENAICDRNNWDNQGTKKEFVNTVLADYLRGEVKGQEWETGEAQRTADHQAATDAAKQAADNDTSLDAIGK
jgi:hypothetical protein